jgi:predicted AAA+ superfamily ATPase
MEIKRSIFKDLVRDLDDQNILILLGARQVGKSTLMLQLKKNRKNCRVQF